VTSSPLQSLPPQLGLGSVHVRLLTNMPPPQVAEHSDSSHSLHPPSTMNCKWTSQIYVCIIMYINLMTHAEANTTRDICNRMELKQTYIMEI